MQEHEKTVVVGDPAALGSVASRRSFLRALGMGGTVVLLPSVFAACGDTGTLAEPRIQQAPRPRQTVSLNLSNDIGILNYAYALEQLEAGFYSAVVNSSATMSLLSTAEQEVMTDLRNHEVIHRDFLRTALGTAAIGTLAADFSSLLRNRDTVLAAARQFEDLGVAAYNGAGKYLRDAGYLLLAGKIVSVEARHAAAIRDILDPTGKAFADNTFETILDANAVERAFEPGAVLGTVNSTGLVQQTLAVGNAPA